MILRLIGLLILVIGASCLLAYAPWQIVLLGFGIAGIGYGVIKFKQAANRRRRMRRLWTSAKEIDLFESFYSETKELEDILDPAFSLPSKEDRDKIKFPHRRKTLPSAPVSRRPQAQTQRPRAQRPQPQYAAYNQSYSNQQIASRTNVEYNSSRRKTFNMAALASRTSE